MPRFRVISSHREYECLSHIVWNPPTQIFKYIYRISSFESVLHKADE